MSSNRARAGSRSSVAKRVHKHRSALRAAGLRPIQIWVPDVRSKSFATQARKQSRAVSLSAQEQDDLAFIESIADWNAK
ncbi:MAG TPA: antitoxin MazE family protein [Steroidobacteraceae bacterium]|nr:antitoxin MazE family protein [Steroidobacteraceae bacterium]